MSRFNIAQVNIGRIVAELTDPVMAGFVNRLDEINALADASPGFVWRLIVNDGNATYLRPFEDQWMLLNMSVWETVEQLRHYVYQTAHVELLRQRHAWFEKLAGVYTALWWVPVGISQALTKRSSALRTLRRTRRRSLRLRSSR